MFPGISVISLLVPTSLWGLLRWSVLTFLHLDGGLVSSEQLKGMHQIVIYILSGGTRNCNSIMNCLSLSLGFQGRLFFFKQTRNGTQGFLYPGRPHRVLLYFTTELTISYFLNIHMFFFIQHYFLNGLSGTMLVLSLQTLYKDV